jgi:hypothetical protein
MAQLKTHDISWLNILNHTSDASTSWILVTLVFQTRGLRNTSGFGNPSSAASGGSPNSQKPCVQVAAQAFMDLNEAKQAGSSVARYVCTLFLRNM